MSDLNERTPMMKGQDGKMVPALLVRMRCEGCRDDHRMLVPYDTPLPVLPELAKHTQRCRCRKGIPTYTDLYKSLRSINGVPLRVLRERGLLQLASQGAFN